MISREKATLGLSYDDKFDAMRKNKAEQEKEDKYPGRYNTDPDKIWVCGACGKTAEYDSFGLEGKRSYGWDESCMMNSVLCHKEKAENEDWVAVEQEEIE
jgi:hypothetical protein